jgi:hypothetical protein
VTTDDAKPIIRTLRDELVVARAYIYGYTHVGPTGELDWRATQALEVPRASTARLPKRTRC